MASSAVISSTLIRDLIGTSPESATQATQATRPRDLAVLVRRAAARCRGAADDAMAAERHHAADEVEHAVIAALHDRQPELADDLSPEALRATIARMATEARSELEKSSAAYPANAGVRIWSAFDAVTRAVGRRRRGAATLGDSELRTVSEVVHDLRSPLSSILLLAESLYDRHRVSGDDVAQRQAGLIHGAALAMHGLVSDVRDLARGAHTLTECAPVSFSVAEIIEQIRRLVRPLAEEKGLGFHVAIPPRLTLTGQPTALTRVLLNLVTNGLKFTESGSVTLTATTDETGVTFVVRDTGTGLPPRVAELVNDGASRTPHDSAARTSGELGVGLGLLLSVRLARLMGGSLRVEETGRAGTCFVLELPPSPARLSRSVPLADVDVIEAHPLRLG